MFKLPDLPYKFEELEPHIDKETMQIHHDKHHAAYVQNLNDALKDYPEFLETDVEDILKDLTKIPDDIRTKVKNNAGGHYNHSLYWQFMSPDFGQSPGDDLTNALKKFFGSFTDFQEKFTAAGLGRFGSGWVWLVKNDSELEIIDTANQDSPVSDGKKPILGLDVWEHAYYLKYQNRRVDYIKAWWNVVNWKEVESKFQK